MSGEQGTFGLLLLSQVIISMQLPFAVIPLIRFTNDRERMGEFANRAWVKTAGVGDGGGDSGLESVAGWVGAGPWLIASHRGASC